MSGMPLKCLKEIAKSWVGKIWARGGEARSNLKLEIRQSSSIRLILSDAFYIAQLIYILSKQ